MSAARTLFALVAVAVLLLGATAAFGYAGYESGDETEVVNESFTSTGNTTVTLDGSNQANTLYSAEVNVTNTSDTVVYEPSGNYTWHDTNGTLFVEENSDLANESEAHITYSYSQTSSEAFGFIQLFAGLTDVGSGLILAVAAAAVLAAARVFGGT